VNDAYLCHGFPRLPGETYADWLYRWWQSLDVPF